MNIIAPDSEGEFLLRVSLAQDFVWSCDHRVTVASGAVVEGAASLRQASAWSEGLEALRDADFNTLGFTFDRLPGMLTFAESESFVDKAVRNPFVSCVITTADLVSLIPERMGVAVCSSPRRAFWDVHNHLAKLTSFYWTDFDSVISPTARIHPKSFVAEKNVIIGSGVVIHPNAVVLDRSIVGDGTEIYPGAVVGSIGFQTMRSGDEVSDLEHAGGVRIGKNARILANAVIARGVFRQFTELGKGVRVGNTAFVSHNSRIGDCAFVGHGAVVNGNVEVGVGAWIGPGASIVHGLSIGDHARVSLGSSVMRDVAPGESVMGAMALGNRRMLRLMASAGEKP
jgi:UDP-3-O-[3-hydroxymyristoyl] glucosamine N-acyltransferase